MLVVGLIVGITAAAATTDDARLARVDSSGGLPIWPHASGEGI